MFDVTYGGTAKDGYGNTKVGFKVMAKSKNSTKSHNLFNFTL